MGKQTDNNKSRNKNEPDVDYELKVLIDKCNVCHSILDTDHHKLCTHHGEKSDVEFSFTRELFLASKNTCLTRCSKNYLSKKFWCFFRVADENIF